MNKPPSKTDSGTPVSTDAEIDAFLAKVNEMPRRPAGGRRGRLIFGMDATASREPTWDHACQIQGEMFSQTAAIGGLEVQLVFYRGFGECKSGKWQPDAQGLARLMSQVRCHAGHTQLGKMLRHAKSETERQKVDALVFVGDAFEEDIDDVCHTAGQLGVLGLPVFLFQEGHDPVATRAFGEIARLTGGAHLAFDMSSADQLKKLLSAVAVYASGGRDALLDYAGRAGGDVLRLTQSLSGQREG